MTPLPTRLRASAQAMRGLFLVSENVPNVRMIYKEDRDRIAAELAEAADALEASQWMPIETAPKDGTMFLCWVSAVRYGETDEGQRYQEEVSQIDFCQWRTQADIPDCGWFEPFCGQIGDEQDVTLWAPLPVAPGAQVAQEGGGGKDTKLRTPRMLTSEELAECCGGCRTNSAIETWMQRAIAKFCEVNGITFPRGVPASEYLAKVEADPRRAAALQRARDRAADGVACTRPVCQGQPRCETCCAADAAAGVPAGEKS